jgi:hypothetical protein
MFCKDRTQAFKRYQRRVQAAMAVYVVVTLSAAWAVKHGALIGWQLYLCSVLPALPVIAVIVAMARYLSEETDEYQRLVVMRSLLMGTAALLGTVVVSDFLRSFANIDPFPPFTCFVVFALTFGITNVVQKMRDKVPADA